MKKMEVHLNERVNESEDKRQSLFFVCVLSECDLCDMTITKHTDPIPSLGALRYVSC